MFNPLENVLFLSPHRDDEVLASGGIFDRCGSLTISYFNNIHPNVSVDVYDKEAELVAKELGCNTEYSKYCCVNHLSDFPLALFISEIEEWINLYKPTLVLIPARSRNQDHQTVYDAAIVAVRPHDTNWFVPNVWVYEQHEYMTQDFVPNIYAPIDIDRKLHIFDIYQSQQRGHRRPEDIKALAKLRGMQYNCEYAEAYMSLRTGI